MSDTGFETVLANRLRQYADGGVRPIDRHAIATVTITTGARRPFAQVLGRRISVLALVALLLLALVGALLVLSTGRPPAPTLGTGYEAIFLRSSVDAADADIDVVSVGADGRERIVRRLTAASLPDSRVYETFGSVSQSGWVAVGTHVGSAGSNAWALIDVTNAARSPRLVPYQPVIGGAWSPHGLFATTEPDSLSGFRLQVVDALTGGVTPLGSLNLPGVGPDIIWAADDSGVVVGIDDGSDGPAFATARADGGSRIPGVPALAPRLMSRYIAQGGTTLETCEAGPQCQTGTVRTVDAQGRAVGWYAGELAPARLLDASFSADGQSVWLLLDRVDGAGHVAVIARADAPSEAQIVRTVDLGPDVAHLWLNGFAPDDSTIAIAYWTGELGGETVNGPTRVVPMSDGAATAHEGNLIGFAPAGIP